LTRRSRPILLLLAATLGACATPRPRPTATVLRERHVDPASPTLQSVLSRPPDLLVTIHPRALSRDSVYGPLLRRASELASAYAGPTTLGTTAMAVLERTEEILVTQNDRGREAVVVLRGVPADVDPLSVVDATGHPVWRSVQGDVRVSTRELAPVDAGTVGDAAMFVAPGLLWIVAAGPAVPRLRAALVDGVGPRALAGDETPLLSLSLPGEALSRLRQGALSTIGLGLSRVKVELTPGSTGTILGTFGYPDSAAAASAETTMLAVTLAFRHKVQAQIEAADRVGDAGAPDASPSSSRLDWLAAAQVERTGASLVVRAPIPRSWLLAIEKAEIPAPGF
jgi:hypothetical protein